jgi:hypothetical protein
MNYIVTLHCTAVVEELLPFQCNVFDYLNLFPDITCPPMSHVFRTIRPAPNDAPIISKLNNPLWSRNVHQPVQATKCYYKPLKAWNSYKYISYISFYHVRLATGWTVRGSNPGAGEIFATRPDRPWGPPTLLYNGYRDFPGNKAAEAWRWPPTASSAKVKERVELYLYSFSRPS